MEKIYASLILKGQKTLEEVPSQIKEAVKEILKEKGYVFPVEQELKEMEE